MLHVPIGSNTFCLNTASWGTTRPAAAFGTAVTPAAGSYGSWANLISAISADAFGILININSNYTSGAGRNTVVNIGIDYAGGTSYSVFIPDLICGSADSYVAGGRSGNGVWYFFPIFIPAGASIGVQSNSTVATAHRVAAMLYQNPANPSCIRKGSFVEAIGISGNQGTAITPGSTSEGSWTSIGTTSKRLWWWQIGVQVPSTDTSHNAGALHYDLAVGDATNKAIIILDLCVQVSASECISNRPLTAGVEWEVEAGSSIYVRAQTSGTAETHQVGVYGLGG
jgi:hypothetical protein